MGTKRIFTLNVAKKLKNMGHKIVRDEPNFKNEKLRVFVFKATKEFYKDLNLIVNKAI
ncbi:hypothetical protein POL82_04250 [Priestia aryabhattai]|uniref:hypothetical protein n=1 Tax=Priestia TaxID=2800373 RepID=UPI00234F454F|nr:MULTISPECIES: hypothetical protein [Priestia]MDC7762660.1 hypothetical protein [Priestia aryabhattai]MED3980884.1 hypothetical protein [Priestia megaterium]